MRIRFVLSLILLSSGLTLLELNSPAQTPAAPTGNNIDINSLLNQIGITGGGGGIGGTAGTSGVGGIAGIGGIGGTGGTAGTAGTAGIAGADGQADAVPEFAPIPPLGVRAETDTPGQRIKATLSGMRTQQQEKRLRALTQGSVKPGQGLANMDPTLTAAIPPPHTVEAVLMGRESAFEFIAYNAFKAALDQTIADVAAIVAVNNPFDPIFGNVRPVSTQPTSQATTVPASATTIPVKRKLRVTAEQLFTAQTIQEFNDELLQQALDTWTAIPDESSR